jgi:hypothetical protein
MGPSAKGAKILGGNAGKRKIKKVVIRDVMLNSTALQKRKIIH